MTLEEIKILGEDLGLEFSHYSLVTNKAVIFYTANGQKGSVYIDRITTVYAQLGALLITKGKILKKLEINNVLSINNPD